MSALRYDLKLKKLEIGGGSLSPNLERFGSKFGESNFFWNMTQAGQVNTLKRSSRKTQLAAPLNFLKKFTLPLTRTDRSSWPNDNGAYDRINYFNFSAALFRLT